MIQFASIDNKAIVLMAFDTLFNKRDYNAAEALWSPGYIQHSAHIAQGRDVLILLVAKLQKCADAEGLQWWHRCEFTKRSSMNRPFAASRR